MADNGQYDSFLSPIRLGSLGFEEAQNSPLTVDELSIVDSVGAYAFIEASGAFPGSDPSDNFSFTASGVDKITVTLNTLSSGGYANLMWLVPSSGVSKVEGDIFGTWSAGEHRSSLFNEVIEDVAEDTYQEYLSGRFTTGLDLSDATLSKNEEFTAIWTLDGGPIRFEITGTQFDGDLPNGNGPAFVGASEVPYTIELTPLDRSFSEIGNGGLLFEDNVPYSETHTGRDTIDTYRVDGAQSGFAITVGPDQTILVENERFSSFDDTLVNIERIQFDDGFLAFDTDGNAGQIYRLYQAAFDRDPDVAGLGHWIDTFDRGLFDLAGVAEEFMISEEFQTRFGTEETLDDAAFLTLLYANVLDRTPDDAGFAFWEQEQAQGLSRAEMLQYFSESDENFANVAAEIDAGIFYL